jgi:hypothetical protein
VDIGVAAFSLCFSLRGHKHERYAPSPGARQLLALTRESLGRDDDDPLFRVNAQLLLLHAFDRSTIVSSYKTVSRPTFTHMTALQTGVVAHDGGRRRCVHSLERL